MFPEMPVLLARFYDEALAQLAAARLEGQGIASIVETKMPSRGLGQRAAMLSVLPADLAQARMILTNSPAKPFLIE